MSERTSDARLLWDQVRYQNRSFWRTPVAAFFALAFPLMFLVLFDALFNFQIDEGNISIAQFYAPSLAVFAAASATYTNMGIRLSFVRDEGILKRLHGTPLPPVIYLGGVVGSAIWIAFIGTVIMVATGVLLYDLEIYGDTIAAATITFLVGSACFACLGLALGAVSPSASAPAIANATLLPLAFLSNVFVDTGDSPQWIKTVGDIFPLKHFVGPMQDAFNPFTDDAAWRWDDLGVLVIWGAIGVIIALRYFRWEPRAESVASTGRSRRRRIRAAAG